MSVAETTGVAALATLLRRLAEDGNLRVAAFAAEEGIARATAFDVARRLREQGFAASDHVGGLVPGPAALTLAWARFGLAPLSGPAEAVMRWLAERIDGEIELSAGGVVLIGLGDLHGAEPAMVLDHPVRDQKGGVRAQLRLSAAEPADPAFARHCLARAAHTLEHYLKEAG
jgi:hypothetical protein